jgi:hypothetical protein
MPICNTKNEFVLGWVHAQCGRSAPVRLLDEGAAEVFWQLLLLFVVTCGIALVGQRLLERNRSRGEK